MKLKKSDKFLDSTIKKSKRGQITIFIILAVIIVAVAVVIYLFYPQIKTIFILPANPQQFMQTCMQNEIKNVIANVSLQGGSMNPQFNYSYYNENLKHLYSVEYLCYTNQYYVPCVMQQPLLQNHIESEIENNIQSTALACFNSLQQNYQNHGYTVNLIPGNITVDILPQRVLVTFNSDFTLTKGNSQQRYQQFGVAINSNLYELVSIANSILNWEVTYGDAPDAVYMSYYHDLIVEKKQQTDGTKVYILTNLNSGEVFQFATRSFVWPLGYGY